MRDADHELRLAAFAHCAHLIRTHGGAVPWSAIQDGFIWQGEQIYLGSTPRGIHRPKQMQRGVLSIKTTKPKPGRVARYDDNQVGSDGLFEYAFQGNDPLNHDNTALRQAGEDRSPFIYFYGLVHGIYDVLFPCFVTEWDPLRLRCTVAVGEARDLVVPKGLGVGEGPDRRYTTAVAKVRIHQAMFRQLVLSAYGSRCAISGLPIPKLLDAAHIIPDRDERGRPAVTNGLCLSKLHHTAYDQNLLGISPDGVVYVAHGVLEQTDGPTLEAVKAFHKERIKLPRREENQPDRGALAERFEIFRKAG